MFFKKQLLLVQRFEYLQAKANGRNRRISFKIILFNFHNNPFSLIFKLASNPLQCKMCIIDKHIHEEDDLCNEIKNLNGWQSTPTKSIKEKFICYTFT